MKAIELALLEQHLQHTIDAGEPLHPLVAETVRERLAATPTRLRQGRRHLAAMDLVTSAVSRGGNEGQALVTAASALNLDLENVRKLFVEYKQGAFARY